ncbi:MAG: carbohydrate kinase [Inquilinus sp.]|nr:carbohydrate kinase [Inquilinus sp.]
MEGPYLLGVDGGTESLRAGLFDTAGSPIGFASAAYPTHFPHPGWAEQDPRDWWRALGEAVRQVLRETGTRPNQVVAICLDTTCCSVVALDELGEPLRPALIWMDVRSHAEAHRVAECGDPALRVNGAGHGPVSAEWMIPKALWLKQNEPEIFDRAAHICEFQDYLDFHLTGRMTASLLSAAVRWHYMAREGGYQPGLLARLGLEALLEKWPRDVVPIGQPIGGLTPAAAGHLGLNPGTKVAQGGSDAFVGMVGLGAVRPGRLALITGSSHLQLGLSDSEFHGEGIWGTYADAVIPGLHVVEGGQTSTGSVVAWFKKLLGEGVTYEALNRDAAALPPGAEGLVVLDHFQGNRTPYTDPNSRGVISGLTLKHGPAHIFRAILEGVAFGSELILETMRGTGFEPQEVVVAGGATRSDLWLQIHADVSGLPLSLTRVADAPALGSAILAAVGAGLFDEIPTAADAMVHVVRRIEPDMARHEAYRPFYQAYKDTYPALVDVLHRQAGRGS